MEKKDRQTSATKNSVKSEKMKVESASSKEEQAIIDKYLNDDTLDFPSNISVDEHIR